MAVASMEGALFGVRSGLIESPIIAVPAIGSAAKSRACAVGIIHLTNRQTTRPSASVGVERTADGGLRHADVLCGPRDAALPHHGLEHEKQPDINRRASFSSGVADEADGKFSLRR
jgi:hypothetical protein